MASPTSELELVNENKWEEGTQTIYKHWSKSTNCEMKFSIFIPTTANPPEKFPVIMFLAGTHTNEHDFLNKTNFHVHAGEFKFVVVCPDTGPKVKLPGDDISAYLGQSASWYIDAVKEPWSKHYQMYSYVSKELPELVVENFPVHSKFGICGFSMGGHGATIIGLRNPDRFLSISLFAPVCNLISIQSKHICIYAPLLGLENKDTLWTLYDASEVARRYDGPFRNILVDQGKNDLRHRAKELNPELLAFIARKNPNLKVNLRFQEGLGHMVEIVKNVWRSHFQHHAEEMKDSLC